MLDTKPLRAALTLSGVQFVPGYRFGLRQPSLFARVDVASHSDVSEAFPHHFWKQVSAHLPERYRLVGTSMADTPLQRLMHSLIQLVGSMQDSVGLPVVDAGKALRLRPAEQPEASLDNVRWVLALPCFAPRAAELALRELLRLLHVLIATQPTGVLAPEELSQFDRVLDEIAGLAPAGTNSHRLLRTALRRQIPMLSLPGGVWQFGWGCKARAFKSSLSDATSAIGTSWAKDKAQTNQLLRQAGLPVPEQVAVRDLDIALREAKRIGYPVVLKPVDLDQGLGVEAGLANETELRAAFARVTARKRPILLEKHIEGQDVRVNVVNGRFQDAIARYPAGVTGDGVRTVRGLVEEVNRDPRRSTRRFADMRPILLGEEAMDLLTAQGLSETSIPAAGRFVRLRRSSNVASGGHTRGVCAEFHPDNARLCEQAAKLLRLDIAGIDLLIPDHRRSWREGGAAICEVNAQPQVGLTYPEIYDHLFDEFLDGQGRIPACLVLTDNPGSIEAIREALRTPVATPGLRVVLEGALRSTQDAYGDSPTLRAAQMDPDASALVVVSNGGSFGQKGLPLDRFDLLWVADWHGAEAQLQQRISLTLPHLASGQIFIDEKLSALVDGQRLPSSHKFRFGDRNAIALAVGQRLAVLSGGPAAC